MKAASGRTSATVPVSMSKKLAPDVIAQLRRMAHDLSNSIETIIQATYLLSQTKLDPNGKKWAGMIDDAAEDAVRINRSLREILRTHNEKAHPKRKAS